VRRLFARDPFGGAAPKWLRIGIWRYRFSESRAGGAWWERERVGTFLPPVSLDSLELQEYVSDYGWAR
jgi:hypothetical protein